jgi:hypothetical protein
VVSLSLTLLFIKDISFSLSLSIDGGNESNRTEPNRIEPNRIAFPSQAKPISAGACRDYCVFPCSQRRHSFIHSHTHSFSQKLNLTTTTTNSTRPMSWSANVETQSMAYGSDDIVFHSKGKVFYRLDNNWKRVDKTYQNGPRLGAGQAPCPSSQIDQEMSEDGILGCKINESFNDGTDPSTTMIHRGSKMYFTTWKNDTNVNVGETDPSLIAECNYMDLGKLVLYYIFYLI